MQLAFSLLPVPLTELESAISDARLRRFMGPDGCKHAALRTYLWNSQLCAEFYFPLQTAEVCIRNAIAATLQRRFTANWFDGKSVPNLLTPKYQNHLAEVVARERHRKRASFNVDHVISGLSFGFWVNLMTSRYKNHFWQMGVQRSFPGAPATLLLVDAHRKVDRLRTFRNKVAHHYAIFDQDPAAEYANLLEVLGWTSPRAQWLVEQVADPIAILQNRPTYPI